MAILLVSSAASVLYTTPFSCLCSAHSSKDFYILRILFENYVPAISVLIPLFLRLRITAGERTLVLLAST